MSAAGAHPTAAAAAPTEALQFAGFWRRFLAMIIDWIIVVTIVSTILLLLASVFPKIGSLITLESPFGLFTVERTLETKPPEIREEDGSTITTTERIVEQSVLGTWTYRYRVKRTETVRKDSATQMMIENWQQIDPTTGEDLSTWSTWQISLLVLFLYWITADASRYQASFGKRVFGIKVVDSHGSRLTLTRAVERNFLKIVSAITFFIGFLMAGWTRYKQALHDKIADCYVVLDGQRGGGAPRSLAA